jgi:DNA-directed RNA polymerase subunit RPC12/RpoP
MSLLNLLGQTRLLQQNQMSSFPQMNNFSSLQQMMSGPTGSPQNQMGQQMAQQSPVPNQAQPKGIVSDKPYVCEICGRGYSYLASLEQHKACHRADHQHQCQGCGRLFKTKDELEKHKLTHNTDGNETRPHQCETCGRRFTLLENLHRHQMIHTDERPFGCHYCHKRFRLAQHLKEHIRIHTGEKPYKCNICGRAFCQISNLKSHQKTHTKVKAFECDICHKTFRRSFTLKQHKLIHERENKNQESKNIEIKSEIKKELEAFVSNQELPFVPVEEATIEEHIEVDVCCVDNSGMSPCQHSGHSSDSLDISMDSDQDNLVQSAVENRKDQASPHSNSDSGHGSPNAKLNHSSSEEDATNSGSDDSGAVVQEKPRFYRPFEDTEKPVAGQWAAAGQKRRAEEIPVDITQTKRVRDTNGKIVVYPGIRESGNRINPTSALDELRQAAGNTGQAHWESLRSDQEFLWRRLGRGQEGVPNQNATNDSELVPVVEWRPVVVGYRSLKDGSVTNREDLPVQPSLMKHPLFPMAFPPINSQ